MFLHTYITVSKFESSQSDIRISKTTGIHSIALEDIYFIEVTWLGL